MAFLENRDPVVSYASPAALPTTDAVSEPERITAIDVTRGLAILGILLVNMAFFSEPFGAIMTMRPPSGSGPLDNLAWYFVQIFCAGKFYPLFSTLFGIGFAIQFDRARRAGRPFAGAYLRRLAALFLFGLLHGALLWYGDILLLYSTTGLVLFGFLMIFPRAGWRSLVGIGIGLALFSIALTVGVNLLMMSASGDAPATRPAAITADSSDSPATKPGDTQESSSQPAAAATQESPPSTLVGQLFREMGQGTITDPSHPRWKELETRAFRDGPYFEALAFRAFNFGIGIVFSLVGFGWHVLGMFFIGAGLMRAGFFSAEKRSWHRALLGLGLLVGLPLVAIAAFLPAAIERPGAALMYAGAMNMLGGPMLSLAYLSGVTLIVLAGGLRVLTGAIASVGRMALTCYLSSTVAATFLMYHWGLGWFGSLSPAGHILVVVGIYSGLLVFANLWLRFFQFGPMEWLWRTLTYLRPPPMLRR